MVPPVVMHFLNSKGCDFMSTQFVSASYQEIIDLHTESENVSVIGIHTPVGDVPRNMFEGFFKQFKKYKYLGCSVSFVPAARLPADPSQVSYEGGEAPIDPRDMLNPIMFHGCHGEDLGTILNQLYKLGSVGRSVNDYINPYLEGDSAFMFGMDQPTPGQENELESLYYKALTDNTWQKAHPQRGFRKAGLRPLVYSLATTHQIMPGIDNSGYGPDGTDLMGISSGGAIGILGEPSEVSLVTQSSQRRAFITTTKQGIQFLTPKLTGLGWIDCYNVLTPSQSASGAVSVDGEWNAIKSVYAASENPTELPIIYMGVILLPPAYKTEQYYRMILTHHFAWKQFRGISYQPTYSVSDSPYENWNNDANNLGSANDGVEITINLSNLLSYDGTLNVLVDGVVVDSLPFTNSTSQSLTATVPVGTVTFTVTSNNLDTATITSSSGNTYNVSVTTTAGGGPS